MLLGQRGRLDPKEIKGRYGEEKKKTPHWNYSIGESLGLRCSEQIFSYKSILRKLTLESIFKTTGKHTHSRQNTIPPPKMFIL